VRIIFIFILSSIGGPYFLTQPLGATNRRQEDKEQDAHRKTKKGLEKIRSSGGTTAGVVY